ncbi:MAG TPA: hypothetical protein VNZ64_04475 [Candidatus Acidoferrum sp.]|nr:hypothetical protein [Candidatus Acidoferrum sp.]
MTRSTTSRHRRNGSPFAAVALMLLLWLGLCALEVSPDLHHFIHQDAQNPAHNCLVTQLQQHSVLSGFVPAAAPAPPAVTRTLFSGGDFQFCPSFDYRLTPSRAPPSV